MIDYMPVALNYSYCALCIDGNLQQHRVVPLRQHGFLTLVRDANRPKGHKVQSQRLYHARPPA